MNLLFIYNSNLGKINALFDAGHKLFSPSTYQCSLCALTYGVFTENSIWKTFRTESNLTIDFYNKDQFEGKFPNDNMIYPVILKLKGHQLTTALNNEILNDISNVEELIDRLKSNL